MSLCLVDRKAMWVPTGDLGAVSNGAHYWLNTSNALTSDATNLPLAAIHTVELNGADAVHIVIGTKLTAVTGDRQCTANNVRLAAWGIPEGVDDIDALSAVPAHRTAMTAANISSRPYTLSAFTTGPSSVLYQSSGLVADYSAIVFIPDSTAPVANDYTLSSVWIGHRTENYVAPPNVATPGSHQHPRVSGMKSIKFAVKFVPTLSGGTTNITALTLTGGMYALLYQEVAEVYDIPALGTTPGYLKRNIAAS